MGVTERQRRRRRARLRGLLQRLLLMVASGLLALTVLEFAVRVGWEQPSDLKRAMIDGATRLEAHPTRIWGMREGVVRTPGADVEIGANGLRLVEETGAETRALTLGDSSIFGHGLADEDTLHVRLGEALKSHEVDVDVFCGGIAGYSSEQTRVLLDEEGWRLEPNLLVLGQLWSDNSYERFVDREWMELLRGPSGFWYGPLKYSRVLQFLHQQVRPKPQADPSDIPRVGWVKKPYETAQRRVPLSDYASNLDAILREAARRGIGVIALQPANRERLSQPRGWAWDPYFDAMAEVMAYRDVLVVDAVSTLDGLTADEAFVDRMHPSGLSNGRYAARIAEVLVTAGWPQNQLVPDADPSPFRKTLQDRFGGVRPLMHDPSSASYDEDAGVVAGTKEAPAGSPGR